MDRAEYITHLTNVAVFLVYLEQEDPNAMWGARNIRDAVNSLGEIMGCGGVALRERILLDAAKPGDDRHA